MNPAPSGRCGAGSDLGYPFAWLGNEASGSIILDALLDNC